MASLLKRTHKHKTTYYVAYRVDGKLVRQKVGKSKVLAERLKGDIEAKIERKEIGFLPKDRNINYFFKEYFIRIKNDVGALYLKRLENVKANFVRFLNKTYLPKQYEFEPIEPGQISVHCSVKNLSQLSSEIWHEYKEHRLNEAIEAKGRPPRKRTVNLELSAINTMLSRAVKWGIINSSSSSTIEYLKEDDSKKVRAFTGDEIKAILIACPKWFEPIIVTTLHTGMRLSEIRFLEWDDVDLKEAKIHIRHKELWHPKATGKKIRERFIPIPKDLVDYLILYRDKAKLGTDNFVFHNSEGKQFGPSLQSVFRKIAKKAGVKESAHFHALRHTYGTQMGKSGVDIVTMQAVLGHADVKTTMRYVQPLEEHMKKEIEKLKY